MQSVTPQLRVMETIKSIVEVYFLPEPCKVRGQETRKKGYRKRSRRFVLLFLKTKLIGLSLHSQSIEDIITCLPEDSDMRC